MTNKIRIFVPLICLLGVFCARTEPAQDRGENATSRNIVINKTVHIYVTCTGKDCRRTGESTYASRPGSTSTSRSGSTTSYDSDENSIEEDPATGLIRIGCYRDKGDRQLGPTHWTFPVNSPALCVAACKQAGFKYAGAEYTSYCFCGNAVPPEKIADSNCNMKCNGAEVFCGGVWALEVFDTKLEQKEHANGLGCFRDKGDRQLGNTNWVFSINSPTICIAACRQKGYKYAGTEAGAWCFCGNILPPEPIPEINCNTKCNGAEILCGGTWALDVYKTELSGSTSRLTNAYDSDEDSSNEGSATGLVRFGCYRDKGDRQLGPTHWTFPVNSPNLCVAACKQAGFKYAGAEYTSYCFCGNTMPPEKIADTNCNMKCNGAESTCGGVWALEVFDTKLHQKKEVDHVGCFRDKDPRQLGNTNWVFSINSPAICIAACRQKGYKYAGTEAGAWCFCGNLLPPESIPDINCNTKCNGVDLLCGGTWALDIYNTGL